MEVLLVEPGKEARIAEIGNDLKSLQAAVGGYIEATYPFDDPVALVCNDEGKIMQMPLNRALRGEDGRIYDAIAGRSLSADSVRTISVRCRKSFKVSTLKNSAGRRSSSPLAATLSLCRTDLARVRTSSQLRSADMEVAKCRRRLSSGH